MSRDLFRKLDNQAGIAFTETGLGNVYEILGDTDSELKAFQAALASALPLNQPDILAWIYMSLGDCYHKKGNMSEAIQNYSLAQPLFENQHDAESLISVYRKMAKAYENIGDRARAIDSITPAISLADKIGDNQLVAELNAVLQEMGV